MAYDALLPTKAGVRTCKSALFAVDVKEEERRERRLKGLHYETIHHSVHSVAHCCSSSCLFRRKSRVVVPGRLSLLRGGEQCVRFSDRAALIK